MFFFHGVCVACLARLLPRHPTVLYIVARWGSKGGSNGRGGLYFVSCSLFFFLFFLRLIQIPSMLLPFFLKKILLLAHLFKENNRSSKITFAVPVLSTIETTSLKFEINLEVKF